MRNGDYMNLIGWIQFIILVIAFCLGDKIWRKAVDYIFEDLIRKHTSEKIYNIILTCSFLVILGLLIYIVIR